MRRTPRETGARATRGGRPRATRSRRACASARCAQPAPRVSGASCAKTLLATPPHSHRLRHGKAVVDSFTLLVLAWQCSRA